MSNYSFFDRHKRLLYYQMYPLEVLGCFEKILIIHSRRLSVLCSMWMVLFYIKMYDRFLHTCIFNFHVMVHFNVFLLYEYTFRLFCTNPERMTFDIIRLLSLFLYIYLHLCTVQLLNLLIQFYSQKRFTYMSEFP